MKTTLMRQTKQMHRRLSATADIALLGEHVKMPSVFCDGTSGSVSHL